MSDASSFSQRPRPSPIRTQPQPHLLASPNQRNAPPSSPQPLSSSPHPTSPLLAQHRQQRPSHSSNTSSSSVHPHTSHYDGAVPNSARPLHSHSAAAPSLSSADGFPVSPESPTSPSGLPLGGVSRGLTYFDNHLEAITSGPSLERARRFRQLSCPRHHRPGDGGLVEYSAWGMSDEDLKKYGVGVLLYFQQLRRLALLFLAMFALAVPSLLINVAGKGLDSGYLLTRTTLGNQGIFNASSPNVTLVYGMDKETIGILTTAMDFSYVTVFLFFVVFASLLHSKVTTDYHGSILTVSRYSVAVSNLPKKEKFTRLDLRHHFTQFGPVVDVSILYNNFNLLTLYCSRGQLRKQLADTEHSFMQTLTESDERKLKELRGKLLMLDHQIQCEVSQHDVHPVCAYVTFERQLDSDKCLNFYSDSFLYYLFLPKHLRFMRKKLKCQRAPEPSNILYHNVQYNKKSKKLRRVLTFLVSALLLSITTVIVYVAQYVHNNDIPQVNSCTDSTDIPSDFNVDVAYENNADGSYTNLINCYCSMQSLSAVLYKYTTPCEPYIRAFAFNNSLVFLTAITTLVMNLCIHYFVTKISQFEKHSSRSSQQVNMAKKLAIGLTLNTGVIIILVNADLSGLWNSVGLTVFINTSGYSDLTLFWYQSVGSSVLLTMMLGVFIPTCTQLLQIVLDGCKRRRKERRCEGVRNQEELNAVFAGRHFTLDERYAQMFVTVSVCLMYSGGIPLMLLVASATFAVTYWCDKVAFTRLYRTPPRYDEQLDSFSLWALPLAALLHSVMDVGFYSSNVTASYRFSSLVSDYSSLIQSYDINSFPLNINDRLTQWNTLPFVVLALALAVGYIIAPVLSLLLCSSCRSKVDRLSSILPHYFGELGERPSYFEASRRVRLESYRLSRHSHWKLAFMLTHSKKQMTAEEDFDDVDIRMQDIREEGRKKPSEEPHQRRPNPRQHSSGESVTPLHYPPEGMGWTAGAVYSTARMGEQRSRGGESYDAGGARPDAPPQSSTSGLHVYVSAHTPPSEYSGSTSTHHVGPSAHQRGGSVLLPNVVEESSYGSHQSSPLPSGHHGRSQSSNPPVLAHRPPHPQLLVVQRPATVQSPPAHVPQPHSNEPLHQHSQSASASTLSHSSSLSVSAPVSYQPPIPRPVESTAPPSRLLSTLSLSQLTSMTPQLLEGLWHQYDVEGRGRLRKAALRQLASDCVERAVHMVEEEVRRVKGKDWGEREIALGVRKELSWMVGMGDGQGGVGVSGLTLEEMRKSMVRRLVSVLDVNGDGDISQAQWNSFSSTLFQVRRIAGHGDITLDCNLM